MRRFTLLLIIAIGSMTCLSAQWIRYDADVLPNTDGDDLFDSFSQNNPGPNYEEMVMPDPDIMGNMILKYYQPDDTAADGDNATKMFRHYFQNPDGSPWLGEDMTIVARLKGLADPEAMNVNRIFDIQYRHGNVDLRDEFRVQYDSTLELDRSNVEQAVNFNPKEWHIYRMEISGGTTTVYVDEDPTPVMTGTSTSNTSDVYMKVGDGGSGKIGGYVDWIAVDISGSYSPTEKPLDYSFTGADVTFDPSLVRIAFISSETGADGSLLDGPYISNLKRMGYHVDITYPTFPDFSFDALENYDVVIIGRGVSSGDFQASSNQDSLWAALSTPVLVHSAYLVRNTRLKLLDTGSAGRETADGNSVDPNRETAVTVENDHPIFTGISGASMGMDVPYHKWFLDYAAVKADTFTNIHNGTVLASVVSDSADVDGMVYMAYWPAGVETYNGAGNILAGQRVYMQMGADDSSSPKVKNYFAFTDESMAILHNVIKYFLDPTAPDGMTPDLAAQIAYWNMEGSGETIQDIYGLAHGTVMNGTGVTREDCGVGNSLNFKGATRDDAVVWVDPIDAAAIDFDSTQSFTISMLVKADPFTNAGNEQTFVLKGDNGTSLPEGMGKWYAVATKESELRFAVDDAVTKTQLDAPFTDMDWDTMQWNHIVAVRDLAVDSLFIYLNGDKMAAIQDNTQLNIQSPGTPLVIGNYHSSARKIDGALDEISMYPSALSAAEVSTLYAELMGQLETNCEVDETFDQRSTDATLSFLSSSEGSLSPTFNPAITSYSVEVPSGTSSVSITATANDSYATVSGDVGMFSTIPGTATITVTAEDTTVKNDYTVEFTVVTSVEDLAENDHFKLKAMPNPFGDQTLISFFLEEAGNVTLRVFDMTGKMVDTWEGRLESGEQTINLTTNELKPGLYIYQLTSGGVTAAGRMIKQ